MQTLCKVFGTYDRNAMLKLEAVLECLKAFLGRKVLNLLSKHDGGAVLRCYSADATPLRLPVRYQVSHAAGACGAVRHGRALEEVFLQVCFFKALSSSGEVTMAVQVADPISLRHGKKAPELWQLAWKTIPSLLSLGHPSLSVSTYCFDRGILSSLGRLLDCSHRQQIAHHQQHPQQTTSTQLTTSTQWWVMVGCAVHDLRNSLKWALLGPDGSGKEVVKSLHVVVESLRNSYDILHSQLPFFIVKHLCLAPSWNVRDADSWQEVWQCMGQDPAVVDELLLLHCAVEVGPVC